MIGPLGMALAEGRLRWDLRKFFPVRLVGYWNCPIPVFKERLDEPWPLSLALKGGIKSSPGGT